MRITARHSACLFAIAALYVLTSIVGIGWGLPTRAVDPYLFGGEEPWSGEKIYGLAHADEKLSDQALRSRGADVDVDPVRASRGPHRTDDAEQDKPMYEAVPPRTSPLNVPPGASSPPDPTATHRPKKNRNLVGGPILLTATQEDVARIYLRYRLYTYQPDEMITMMALAGMRPGAFRLDPRLYQYGGLWIYPVGGLIKLCGAVGLIDVRSDLAFYLDNPDEFGKFYLVARAYAAAWGLMGVFVVFAITRRIVGGRRRGGKKAGREEGTEARRHGGTGGRRHGGGEARAGFTTSDARWSGPRADRAGLVAALLFIAMPVVVCMAHEGKPHLPGAVLMLMAVYFAMRAVERAAQFRSPGQSNRNEATAAVFDPTPEPPRTRGTAHALLQAQTRSPHRGPDWWMMCISCGAALGMVLSSAPIFLLIPLAAWLCQRRNNECRRGEPHPAQPPDGAPIVTRSPTLATQPEPPASTRAAEPIPGTPSSPGTTPAIGFVRQWFTKTFTGVAIAMLVYLVTNPYVFINALTNRAVLASNFGNSLGMYEISRIGEGLLRVLQLTIEGATLPIVMLGFVALVMAIVRRWTTMIPLVAAAVVFFFQFVLIGAGKPAEYGRFGIFPNTALAIGAAILITTRRNKRSGGIISAVAALAVTVWSFVAGGTYLVKFVDDGHVPTSRIRVRSALARLRPVATDRDETTRETTGNDMPSAIALSNDPAPYNCPPIDFAHRTVLLFGSAQAARSAARADSNIGFIQPIDRFGRTLAVFSDRHQPAIDPFDLFHWFAEQPAPISWAGKTFEVVRGALSETVGD